MKLKTINEPQLVGEGLRAASLAALTALTGAGCQPSDKTRPTSQAAIPHAQQSQPGIKGWNSELGDFEAIKQPDGKMIYRTQNGDFKIIKDVVGDDKFVKIR